MKYLKPLNGRESSLLCLLALSRKHLSRIETKEILSTLTGNARKIGKAILGRKVGLSKSIITAANGFLSWAKNIK
jgi:hypothetical protein